MIQALGSNAVSECASARFPARPGSVVLAREWVAGYAGRARLPRPMRLKLELIVEELMTNTVKHGRPDPGSQIEIAFESAASGAGVSLTYVDRGNAFDPTAITGPPPSGGFGLSLIRGLSVELAYERRCDANHLRLSVPLSL